MFHFGMQMSYDKMSARQTSTKILCVVSGLCCYLLYTFYTCDLTARMTSTPPKAAIRSFYDVLKHDYKVIVRRDTSNRKVTKIYFLFL